jgi:ABC-type multidrug transport system ATPase subunit
MEIKIQELHKAFGGNEILQGVDLQIVPGDICCLLGKNGAGKTTLINLLLQLLEPQRGRISYDGLIYGHLPLEVKQRIGVLGDNNPLIEELTALQYLRLSGKLYKVPARELEKRIADLLEYFFDEEVATKRLSAFSTGMKKKIGLCAAVLHTPDLLILDEPFSGLDPLAAQQTLDFIKSYRKDNRSIFLSSHDLSYVEKIATRIVVLHEGQIRYDGSPEDFRNEGDYNIDSALLDILKGSEVNQKVIEWI